VGRPVALGRVPSLPVVVGVGQVPVARGRVRAGRRRRRLADVGLGQQPRRTAVQHARQVRDVVQITPDEPDQTLSETRVSDKVCWVRSGFAQITLGGPGWTLSLVGSGRVVRKFHYKDPTRPHPRTALVSGKSADFVWSCTCPLNLDMYGLCLWVWSGRVADKVRGSV